MPNIDSFCNFFTSSDISNKHYDDVLTDPVESATHTTTVLNRDFSFDEIREGNKLLKRVKARGLDLIDNSYLIDAFDTLGPLPTKLSNSCIHRRSCPYRVARWYN